VQAMVNCGEVDTIEYLPRSSCFQGPWSFSVALPLFRCGCFFMAMFQRWWFSVRDFIVITEPRANKVLFAFIDSIDDVSGKMALEIFSFRPLTDTRLRRKLTTLDL
jgi:hypothetical protein